MNKKDLYGSIEKEMKKIIDEDMESQDITNSFNKEKEAEILKNSNKKKKFIFNKKIISVAAIFMVAVISIPIIYTILLNAIYVSKENAYPSDFAGNSSAEIATETSAEIATETSPSEAGIENSSNQIYEIDDNPDSKIVYTFGYYLQTTDFENTVELLRSKVKTSGGYIAQMSVNSSSNNLKNGYFTIRIPKEQSEDFQRGIGELGNITDQDLNTEDLTKNYADIESQVEALKIKETRYLELLKTAENMEDILTIESHLADVQHQLNYLNQDLKNIDYDVNYNYFVLNISEVEHLSGSVGTQNSFGSRLSDAFRSSFINFLYFIQNTILFLVRNIVFIIVIVLIALFITYLIKRKKKS